MEENENENENENSVGKQALDKARRVAQNEAKKAAKKATKEMIKLIVKAIKAIVQAIISFVGPALIPILIVVIIVVMIAAIVGSIFGNENSEYYQYGGGGYSYIGIGNSGTGNIGYSSISIADEDLLYLYTVVINERGNGTNEQMSYVASVVLNRVLCGYGSTIKAVITAPNQFQGCSDNTVQWQQQFNAVKNYMNTGNSNDSSWTNDKIQNIIDVCTNVIQTGDTTGTPDHPEGGATGFAGPSWVRTWLASSSYINAGWYGLFNDEDGPEEGTSGNNWNNGGEWGTISYMACSSNVAILSQYRQAGGQGVITGNYNADIANNAKSLAAQLQQAGWKYNTMTQYKNLVHPLVNSNGSASDNNPAGKGISCATFVGEVLYRSGIFKEGQGVIWARHSASEVINDFASAGVTLTQITDCNQAQPGDIIHYYNPNNSKAYHTAIITDVNNGNFRKTGSAEFIAGFSDVISSADDRSWRGYSPLSYLSQRWLVFRVTAVDGIASK